MTVVMWWSNANFSSIGIHRNFNFLIMSIELKPKLMDESDEDLFSCCGASIFTTSVFEVLS